MEALGVLVAACVIIAVLLLLGFSRLYRKVDQSQALIVSKTRRVDVSFTGQVVLPILHKADLRGAGVRHSNLFGADLARVRLDGNTLLDGALLTRARTWPRLTPEQQAVTP